MATIKLVPYLFFGGNCRDAMEFYKDVFGGELTLTEYGEGPEDAHSDPKANTQEMKSKIMYSKLDGPFILQASDSPYREDGKKIDAFSLSLEGDDAEKLTAYFKKLSAGGDVSAPLEKQFWGDTFGMLTDRFGVSWMVSIQA
ncbi:VOC family protein [Dyadobacter sandarakinus]|uniref:VOC family protein n=1 Tax=Dyadobacter sandarakinus TaxID=2747268 RepID=A0ABX7I199_9BACT|nr:VOC family protein [Dyadobacter sandarakinus]QRQ99850.1 VOC family protein [Dyadobacter sandarakinus]